jgi:hypothetical protein
MDFAWKTAAQLRRFRVRLVATIPLLTVDWAVAMLVAASIISRFRAVD